MATQTKKAPAPKQLRVSTQHAVSKIVVETPLGNNIIVEFSYDGEIEDSRVEGMLHDLMYDSDLEPILNASEETFRDMVTALVALREEFKKGQMKEVT